MILDSYKFEIGNNNNDEKILYFKSSLNLKNIIIKINPFGTSRLRYQREEDLFDINLITENNNDNYKLVIKKTNNSRKGVNSRLFWDDGWKINLILWFSVKLNIDLLTSSSLFVYFPNNYGTYDFSGNITSCKCGIVIPIYNRNNYVNDFLESIKKSDLSNTIIILMDESITNSNEDDNIKTHNLVKNFQLLQKNCILIKIYKNKHGNMFDSILHGMDFLYTFCPFLITLDSDTIHKPYWISKLFDTYNDAKNNENNNNICCTGFNVVNNRHIIKKTHQNYLIKESIGGCNMFFSRELYINNLRKTLMSHKWDTNIVNEINNINGLLISTNPSVIQHIGVDTSINRKDKQYDYALDF